MIVNFYEVFLALCIVLGLYMCICIKYAGNTTIVSSILVTVFLLMILNIILFTNTIINGTMYDKEKYALNTYEVQNIRERVINTTGFSISRDNCEEVIVDDLEYPVLEEIVYKGYKDYLFLKLELYTNEYVLKIPKEYS